MNEWIDLFRAIQLVKSIGTQSPTPTPAPTPPYPPPHPTPSQDCMVYRNTCFILVYRAPESDYDLLCYSPVSLCLWVDSRYSDQRSKIVVRIQAIYVRVKAVLYRYVLCPSSYSHSVMTDVTLGPACNLLLNLLLHCWKLIHHLNFLTYVSCVWTLYLDGRTSSLVSKSCQLVCQMLP